MELRNIEQVVERYFEGDTTLQEEQQLRSYFTGGQVAPHLEEYVVLFSAFAKAKTTTYDAPIELPKPKARPVSWMRVAAVAAVVIISFSIFSKPNPVVGGTYKDNPDLAIQKTKETFGIVSQMLSKGTAQLGVVREFNNVTSSIISND